MSNGYVESTHPVNKGHQDLQPQGMYPPSGQYSERYDPNATYSHPPPLADQSYSQPIQRVDSLNNTYYAQDHHHQQQQHYDQPPRQQQQQQHYDPHAPIQHVQSQYNQSPTGQYHPPPLQQQQQQQQHHQQQQNGHHLQQQLDSQHHVQSNRHPQHHQKQQQRGHMPHHSTNQSSHQQPVQHHQVHSSQQSHHVTSQSHHVQQGHHTNQQAPQPLKQPVYRSQQQQQQQMAGRPGYNVHQNHQDMNTSQYSGHGQSIAPGGQSLGHTGQHRPPLPEAEIASLRNSLSRVLFASAKDFRNAVLRYTQNRDLTNDEMNDLQKSLRAFEKNKALEFIKSNNIEGYREAMEKRAKVLKLRLDYFKEMLALQKKYIHVIDIFIKHQENSRMKINDPAKLKNVHDQLRRLKETRDGLMKPQEIPKDGMLQVLKIKDFCEKLGILYQQKVRARDRMQQNSRIGAAPQQYPPQSTKTNVAQQPTYQLQHQQQSYMAPQSQPQQLNRVQQQQQQQLKPQERKQSVGSSMSMGAQGTYGGVGQHVKNEVHALQQQQQHQIPAQQQAQEKAKQNYDIQMQARQRQQRLQSVDGSNNEMDSNRARGASVASSLDPNTTRHRAPNHQGADSSSLNHDGQPYPSSRLYNMAAPSHRASLGRADERPHYSGTSNAPLTSDSTGTHNRSPRQHQQRVIRAPTGPKAVVDLVHSDSSISEKRSARAISDDETVNSTSKKPRYGGSQVDAYDTPASVMESIPTPGKLSQVTSTSPEAVVRTIISMGPGVAESLKASGSKASPSGALACGRVLRQFTVWA